MMKFLLLRSRVKSLGFYLFGLCAFAMMLSKVKWVGLFDPPLVGI
jgi:hypothetical protein